MKFKVGFQNFKNLENVIQKDLPSITLTPKDVDPTLKFFLLNQYHESLIKVVDKEY